VTTAVFISFFCILRLVSVQDGEAYAYLLSALAPEHSSKTMIETSDPKERAKKVLETAEKLKCTRYVTPKDIVEGSANLNLAFVAQIFQNRQVEFFLSIS
jgi:plastin-1